MTNLIADLRKTKVNFLLILVTILFVFEAGMIMFYSNGIFTFSNKYSFYSINRAADFADSNFSLMKFDVNFDKAANGILYPFIISLFYKIVGKDNIIALIYVLSFIIIFSVASIFERIVSYFFSEQEKKWIILIFLSSAPVVISLFSGSDILLTFLIFSLNLYFLIYELKQKKYLGAIITSLILFLCGFIPAIFGFVSIVYIIIRFIDNYFKKRYVMNLIISVLGISIFCVLILIYVFLEKLSIEDIQKTAFFDNKTFYVDSFFKDGFLWSKNFLPLLGMFFYIGIFLTVFEDIKNRKISLHFYSLFLTIAAILIEFFSVFSKEADTVYYITPFYIIFILYGCLGLNFLFSFIKNISFKNTLILAVFLFIILYNIVLTFNFTIEYNNNIRFLSNEYYVKKFTEK